MEFTNFRFVFIQPDYLEALHNVDSEIFYSIDTDYSKKPHLGILTTCNGRKYVIPLTSAKRKHASWRDVTTTNYRVYEEIDTMATIVDKYDIIVDETDLNKLRQKGIPEDERTQIFTPFYQVGHTTGSENMNGTGIGLSLTQSVVHLHHGEIGVTANTPKGSIFTILLPNHTMTEEEVANTAVLS